MLWRADRLTVVMLALGGVGSGANACATQPPSTQTGPVIMNKSGSRIPAPAVAPIEQGGIRYEQVKNGLSAGFDQMGGFLAAIDVASGSTLWTLKVYDNQRVPGKEGDVQDVFFRHMQLQDDGTLLIENERGGRFIVNLKNQTIRPAP